MGQGEVVHTGTLVQRGLGASEGLQSAWHRVHALRGELPRHGDSLQDADVTRHQGLRQVPSRMARARPEYRQLLRQQTPTAVLLRAPKRRVVLD